MEYNKDSARKAHVTLPFIPKEELVSQLVEKMFA
jgi:hypothetical protein